MPFSPTILLDENSKEAGTDRLTLPSQRWHRVVECECDFSPDIFLQVSTNMIQNPNLTSSHLFRADILYDDKDEMPIVESPTDRLAALQEQHRLPEEISSAFEIRRRMVRQLVPRNPQLDKPMAQTCYCLYSRTEGGLEDNVIMMIPEATSVDEIPWYHPSVQAVAIWHRWSLQAETSENDASAAKSSGMVSVHFRLFPEQDLPITSKLSRTAQNLLSVNVKHGKGTKNGYVKRVNHDQLISQKRVQDRYAQLKAKYARRLCDNWVEQTEPSKHVFEDLGIAAFLIELWADMYAPPGNKKAGFATSNPISMRSVSHTKRSGTELPQFPGFIDIGCGNGVLTEILLGEGFPGEGFDARRRKTWSILSARTQSKLEEALLVPSSLFELHGGPSPKQTSGKGWLQKLQSLKPQSQRPQSTLEPPKKNWLDGTFSKGTFIVSNHADELTAWTPLLAYLNESPFLAIPCCSHNLSGERFRAPSACNSQMAGLNAPSFFSDSKGESRAKFVPISIPMYEDEEKEQPETERLAAEEDPESAEPNAETATAPAPDTTQPTPATSAASQPTAPTSTPALPPAPAPPLASGPERGDLTQLSCAARRKQPSAYASLCDWIRQLSRDVGFAPETEALRIPSTRNVGLVGRACAPAFRAHTAAQRRALVLELLKREGADGVKWVERCEGVLAKEGGKGHAA